MSLLKTNKMACVPGEESDQPGHPPSLIGVFTVRMKKAWVLSFPLSAQQRLRSDWADAQADLSLRWAHSHFVGFVVRRLNLVYHNDPKFLDRQMPGMVVLSEACPLGMQAAPEFDPHVWHILSWRLGAYKNFYGHSPSSADSRRAVVSYWRKNVH